jgi:hypothetical protein
MLNPYLTVSLAFLAKLVLGSGTRAVFERTVLWVALAALLGTGSRAVSAWAQMRDAAMLNSGASSLADDWAMRRMEWVYRRLYETGFWGDEKCIGLKVLGWSKAGGEGVTDGIIEDEDEDLGRKTRSLVR